MADFIGYLASLATLKKAVVMLEQWEQANLELRGHIQVLIRRLERVGGYVDITTSPAQSSIKSHLKLVDS
jgi:hypothetical protein